MALYFEKDFVDFEVLGKFDVHEWSSMGYWQIASGNDCEVTQIIDVHDFLLDCEKDGLCIYTGSQLYVFVTRMIDFMNEHDLMGINDLKDYDGKLWDDIEPIDIDQILSEVITYELDHYCNGLCSNDTHHFGSHFSGGGCLGYWLMDED